jgi:signal peptidase I
LAPSLRQLWKNEYFQTVIMILLIVMVVFGFWFGIRLALNTDYPVLAVASGSMCLVQPYFEGQTCDGWSHPFGRTLHTGDLIIVQGVRPQDIYAAPFNESGRSGDILVFRLNSGSEDLIVHRAIAWYDNTTLVTKGDGNPTAGPPSEGKVRTDLVVGKVVLRIPWVGHLALFMRDRSGVYLVLALIIIIIIVELALSIPGSKETEIRKDETVNETSKT